MTNQVVSPRWKTTNPFGGGKIIYVEERFLDFDKPVWHGSVKSYWTKCKAYLQYLKDRTTRRGDFNSAEVYDLMARNVDHILAGEPLDWAVNRFGYEKAVELAQKPTFPGRSGFLETEDGRVLSKGHGGISDGEYENFMPFLHQIYQVTMGIDQNNWQRPSKGRWTPLPLEENVRRLEDLGLPYQIVDKVA